MADSVSDAADNLLDRLARKERTGSKPRCHWLTHGTREQVANRLTGLVAPWGKVSVADQWMPGGFCRTEEAQLHKVPELLSQEDCEQLRDWWLVVSRGATRTPNWDVASTCVVGKTKGILLVEAKAHSEELNGEQAGKALKPNSSKQNHERIGQAIAEANSGLMEQTGYRWALSRDCCYQMSNRFAWAWKLTELGYPVILVYLGFLRAGEMRRGESIPFDSHPKWSDLVKTHSQGAVPAEVWDSRLVIHGQSFVPRICSLETPYDGPMEDRRTG